MSQIHNTHDQLPGGYVNHEQRFVIFGSWDTQDDGVRSMILNEQWELSRRGRKQPAYKQSREHIRLVEEDGYGLFTFPMQQSRAIEDDEQSPAKIESFTPQLDPKHLLKIETRWFATSEATSVLPEEVRLEETFIEGAAKTVAVNAYERSAPARRACLAHWGYKCIVCEFDFEERYGELGRGYIHVHHILALSEIRDQYEVNPVKDLVPVCPNCHAMIHSVRPALTIEQLRRQLQDKTPT